MRLLPLLLVSLSLTPTSLGSSWFGSSEPAEPYQTWSVSELKTWLNAHGIPPPPKQSDLKDTVQENWEKIHAMTSDQYDTAQKSFKALGDDIRDASFETWDTSRLRAFLLEQGVVAPKGPKEHLVQLAKSRYRAYQSAISSFSDRVSSTVYGDSTYQATQSLSSLASKATDATFRVADDAKDYVYSAWSNSQIIDYLEAKGVKVENSAKESRSRLLALMYDAYAKVTQPVYDAWDDSYIHAWLVHHKIIAPKPPSPYSREYLLSKMKEYYYETNATVYSAWSDSQLNEWLVKHGIIKSDAQIKREKMLRLVQDNYARVTSSLAWSDSQMREWLVEHGYIDDRNAAQMKRDELYKMVSDKYHDATTPSYLAWPDARLRAYLRQNGVSEDKVPTSRPGLLQEARILWVRTQNNSEALWAKVQAAVSGVEEGVEERLWRLWNMLKGSYGQGEEYAEAKYTEGKEKAHRDYEQQKERAYEKAQDARQNVGDKVKYGGEKIKGEL